NPLTNSLRRTRIRFERGGDLMRRVAYRGVWVALVWLAATIGAEGSFAQSPDNRGTAPVRSRFGVPIPTCPLGMGYSTERQRCIPAERIGGTIPCSEDDATFTGGRWVSNCQ